MKGYKGFKSNLTCRGFQFKIGETFTIDEPISLCHTGYHFCKSLCETFQFYEPDENNVFCESEASGEIQKGDDKCVCSQIKIIKIIPKVVVNRALYGKGYGDGDGYGGYGYGGYGNGCGDGNGYGDGDGYGGYGYGGYGYGGYGYGYGNGDGNGDYGYGCYKTNIHKCIILK